MITSNKHDSTLVAVTDTGLNNVQAAELSGGSCYAEEAVTTTVTGFSAQCSH